MTRVFFYGLFMDPDLLEEQGFHPGNVESAYLPGYQLKIGERATLLSSETATCYGTVIDLDESELSELYQGEGVKDYEPISVKPVAMDGDDLEAVSYILPIDKLSGSNSEYAEKLAAVALKLDLPVEYVHEIEKWI